MAVNAVLDQIVVHKPHSTSVVFDAVSTAVLFKRQLVQLSTLRPPSLVLYCASKHTASSSILPSAHLSAQSDPGTV
jgi:hypothetical protein